MRYIELKVAGLAAVTALMLMTGCAKDRETDRVGGGAAGNNVKLIMTLNVPYAMPARGLSAAQEGAVNDIDIFVFDKDLKLTDWRYGELGHDAGNITFSATLKASKNNDDKFRLMTLANVRNTTHSIFQGDDLGGHKGKTYADVRDLLQAAVPPYSEIATNGIPMWGELKNMVLLTETDNNYDMYMLRSLARVDVGTNPDPVFTDGQIGEWVSLDNFSLEKVYVYNASSTYALTADREFIGNNQAMPLSLPSPNTKRDTPYEYSNETLAGTVTHVGGKGVCITANIYTGESHVKMGESGTYADNSHLNRMAIVVAGYYSPDPQSPNTDRLSYYRLDFLEGVNGSELMDVMRNHNYQIVIRSVDGPGSDTEEEAFGKFNTDMVAVVKSWSDAEQGGTVVDGDHYLKADPYGFAINKWAHIDEEITIETNFPEAGGESWAAEVVKYNADDDEPSWLTIVPGTGSGISGGVLKFNVEQVPEGSPESYSRSARLRISSGTMVLDIIVKQTGKDSEHLLRLSHSELIFAGRKWDESERQWVAPDPQTITVKWNPRKWPYYMSLTNYTGGGVDMVVPVPGDRNTPTLTISPAAIMDDNSGLSGNPFFERSSRLAFTAKNTDGMTDAITKQVLIRQIYYSLVVSGTKDYYYMGSAYRLNIKSNSPWKATLGGDLSVLTSYSGTSGVGNTSDGEYLTIRISTRATIGARATVTFSSPDNLFPPQTFNIIAQNVLPNCYVIVPGGSTSIPVRKAYRVWELDRDLYNDESPLPAGEQKAVLLWQDTENLIKNNISLSGTGRDTDINVSSNSGKEGNAVVAFMIGDKIYWSWHLWVTGYDPGIVANQGSANGYVFMDRNLGALGTSGYEAFGLYYQGGRKDPYPPTAAIRVNNRKKIYNINNEELQYGDFEDGYIIAAPPYGGLPVSIQNPMHYLYGAYGSTHWYGLLYDVTRSDLWENTVYKSDYDPCPEGWKVAREASLIGLFDLERGVSASGGFTWEGMYFPAQYHINYGNGLISGTTHWEFTLWYTRTNHNIPLMWVNSTTERGSNNRQCNGAPVRCIKE